MCVNSLAFVRVKGGEEVLRVGRGVRQGCIMFTRLIIVYMNPVLKEGKRGWGKWVLDLWRRGKGNIIWLPALIDFLGSVKRLVDHAVPYRCGSLACR